MAKKKTKKSSQKQAEAAPPPENVSAPTTTPPATANGTSPEDHPTSIAPPPKTANVESPLDVPVAASDEASEGIPKEPTTDATMGAGQTTNNVVTQSLGDEDMGVRTAESVKEANDSTADDLSHVTVAEAHSQPNVADVVDSHAEFSDISCTTPNLVIAADVTALPISNDQHAPAPNVDEGEAQALETPATTVPEGTGTTSQALKPDHAVIEEPLTIGAEDDPSSSTVAVSAGPAVAEPEVPPPNHDTPIDAEIGPEAVVEAGPPSSMSLNTPPRTRSPVSSQHIDETEEPHAIAHTRLEKPEVLPHSEMQAQEHMSSSTPIEPQLRPSTGMEEQVIPTAPPAPPPAIPRDDMSVLEVPHAPTAKEEKHKAEAPIASFDPPVTKKETPKQRRRREAEEAEKREEEREERERLEQESFEQYRIDQERLEMARLEQKRLERAKNRQERLEKERAEQQRLETERIEKERLERERLEHERVERERLEFERVERERFEKERLEKERVERERLEHERLEQERLRQERLEKERAEQKRLELERLERDRLKQERLEQEIASKRKLEMEQLEKERLEKDRILREQMEKEIIEKEPAALERPNAELETVDQNLFERGVVDGPTSELKRSEDEGVEKSRLEIDGQETEKPAFVHTERTQVEQHRHEGANEQVELESERIEAQQHEARPSVDTSSSQAGDHSHVERRYAPSPTSRTVMAERQLSPMASHSTSPAERQRMMFKEGPDVPAQLPTPHSESSQHAPMPKDMRASNPSSRLPTPTTSVGRGSSPRSAPVEDSQARSSHSPSPAHRSQDVGPDNRHASGSPALPAPRPQAISQIIAESRPPAPSPPVGRSRPRHVPAFDTDDDSDSSAMVRPRRQYRGGEEFPRDDSSGSAQHGYPPQPTHHRSVFASRVPAEPAYSNPPPPQPPGYHPGVPGYYPSTAPPHYQNHTYRVSQPGYPHTNAYGPSNHSSSSPYTEPWNYPPGYRHDSPPHRHDTLVPRDYPLGLAPLDTRPALGDDPGDVFSRIAQAIPDLHVLLARYKETHGQLSVREELLRRSTIEQEQRLRLKDDEIAELRERTRTLEQKYSTEAGRLRFQIGNLEEQAKELQEQRAETDKFKREASESKIALDVAMRSSDAKYKELEEAHAILARTAAEDKATFEEWKSTYTTRNDAEKIALAIQFDKRLKEADVLAESQRQEVIASYIRERDELRLEFDRQESERQASFDRERIELETRLEAAQRDRDEALQHERESHEMWQAEREALLRSHEDDREGSRKSWDEQRDLLEAQHQKNRDESDKAWIELHADAAQKVNEEKARVDELVKEREELQKRFNALKAESEQEKAIIKSVASNLESEKSRLEKLMECYGDIAEIKSKGDTYYLVSFSQLQKQIIDLATTHFVHLPVRPPSEDLAQVPSNLPSFLGDTIASRQVRSAYVAHTVSKLITYRVFGPFLFSLGRRYDKADSLFLSMSHHIRDKSTRKEAIWRQQTLLAAFTSSGAKQRINTAAGTVVEEIVNAIKHFADPREEEGIKIAVKRIVKLAAETWRFARLEREMVNATMPAFSDEEHQFTAPEYWPSYESYKPEGTLIGSLDGTSPPSDEKPKLLLRLFPVIWREPKHENFHNDGEKPDAGCIFHHGLALYDDAEPVVQRMDELRSAGLPSYTTTSSPTIAENGKFPPPIVPPPRAALPNPPATAEPSERSTPRSTPPSPTQFLEKSSSRQTTPPPPPSSIQSLIEQTPAMPPVKAYKRPPPGQIDFASPRNLIGMPPPIESMMSSQPSTPQKTSIAPPVPRKSAAISTESIQPAPSAPPPPPSSAPPPPPPPAEDIETHRQPTPAESAIIPTEFPEPSPSDGKSQDLPTPPHSRSCSIERPISPLFEAIDEIEALQPHRSRQPSKSMSRRRSTHSRRSKDEMPEVNPTPDRSEHVRRTSGYALSTRSAKTVDSERTDRSERTERSEKSEKSEKTERTDKSDRDPKSRYMCESRSAAVKALYPNSPMAQSGSASSKNSVSSSKNSISSSKKKDRDSKELKREKSIPDNGTWDTSSNLTSEAPNSELSG